MDEKMLKVWMEKVYEWGKELGATQWMLSLYQDAERKKVMARNKKEDVENITDVNYIDYDNSEKFAIRDLNNHLEYLTKQNTHLSTENARLSAENEQLAVQWQEGQAQLKALGPVVLVPERPEGIPDDALQTYDENLYISLKLKGGGFKSINNNKVGTLKVHRLTLDKNK